MKKIVLIILSLCLVISVFSQNPISIETVINDLDWENCTESDVIFAFKDNVVKRDKEETWNGGGSSFFILKNVKIGAYTTDANIIVNKYNRKLLKIGGMTIGKNYDWSKGADALSKELEDYFSSFWGKERKKTIVYDAEFVDGDMVYTNIDCEWGNSRLNEKTCTGSFYLSHRREVVVIAIVPK
ncbi:MAG: hypothetical protein IJ618_01125 [Prevotella sp.]|nr:hypothetical protein [Prevotella sp.]